MSEHSNFHILIADDHELILQAMQNLVRHLRPNMICHLASDWSQLLAVLDSQEAMDLAVIDLHMPDSSLEQFIALSHKYPELPLAVVSAETCPDMVHALFEHAHIKGFIPKTDQAAVLLQALKLILAGGKYLPALMLDRTLKSSEPTFDKPATVALNISCQSPANPWGLSKRLQDVLKLLAQGLSNKVIARQLGISDLTVKTHVNLLFRQMGVKNRAEATALYLRHYRDDDPQ